MIHPDDPLYLRIQRNNKWLLRVTQAVIATLFVRAFLYILGVTK